MSDIFQEVDEEVRRDKALEFWKKHQNLIIAGAALIMVMLDRFPIFIWAGAALLGWVAGDVVATDRAVFGHVSAALGEAFARQVEFAAAGAGALLVIGIGGLWRQLSLSKAHSVSAAEQAGGG